MSVGPQIRAQVETQFGAELEAIFMRVQKKINNAMETKERIIEECEPILNIEIHDIEYMEKGEELKNRLSKINRAMVDATQQLSEPRKELEECWREAFEDLEHLSTYYKTSIFPKFGEPEEEIYSLNELLDVMLLYTSKSCNFEMAKNIRLKSFSQMVRLEEDLSKREVMDRINKFKDMMQRGSEIAENLWYEKSEILLEYKDLIDADTELRKIEAGLNLNKKIGEINQGCCPKNSKASENTLSIMGQRDEGRSIFGLHPSGKMAKAPEQQKKLPPQVEQMLASAKEMEAVLTKKLTKIDAVSQEKSEMAKREATKIKSDVEEIKRLSLVQTKEGEEALKAKIMEVNQRIEATTRKAAELQIRMIALQQELYSELRLKVVAAQKMVKSLEEIPAEERTKFIACTNYMVVHAGKRLLDMQEYISKLDTMQHKMDLVESVQKMSKEDAVKLLEDQEKAVDMYKQTLDEIREITNDLLKVLAIKKQNISQDDANLVLNRVLTFEKHAALRTEYSLKVLQEIRRLVMKEVDACTAEFVSKKDLLTKVEYIAKLLNSFCPGTIRPPSPCPAAAVRRKKRPQSQ